MGSEMCIRDSRSLPEGVAKGDVMIGLASDGVHSNGYSLVRRIVERSGLSWGAPCPWGEGTLGEALLMPTCLYVKGAKAALDEGVLHGLAHITGGGLTENVPRMLPKGLAAEIDLNAWALPPVFKWLAAEGGMDQAEMLKTFNSGIGMVAAVPADGVEAAIACFTEAGHTASVIGDLVEGEGVIYRGSLS